MATNLLTCRVHERNIAASNALHAGLKMTRRPSLSMHVSAQNEAVTPSSATCDPSSGAAPHGFDML